MDIDKRNRTELKTYFRKNSVPTESNFAELVDGMLNQTDDGIVKPPGDPLSIQASGDDASQKKLINLYRDFSDPGPHWTLSLNPRTSPTDPATARAGFSISDGDGNSRLFIDRSSGNLGIGTLKPEAKLDVMQTSGMAIRVNPAAGQSVHVGRYAENALEFDYGNGQALNSTASLSFNIDTDNNDANIRYIDFRVNGRGFSGGTAVMRILENGNVGIGTTDPGSYRLRVEGDLYVSGAISKAGRSANYEIYLRGSAFDSLEGNNTYVIVDGVPGTYTPGRGLNTFLLYPDGRLKNQITHDIYGNVVFWNSWADWVNSNSSDGDVIAVASYDALQNAPRGGSAETLLQNIGAEEAFTAVKNHGRSPYALLFVRGRAQCMEISENYAGPNAHLKTTYHTLLNLSASVNLSVRTPAFQNNWINYGDVYNPAGYCKDGSGIVHLRGLVKNGVIGTAIFTLPAGYRPQNRELLPVQTNANTIGRLDILTNGEVTALIGNNGWYSLDGATFRAAR